MRFLSVRFAAAAVLLGLSQTAFPQGGMGDLNFFPGNAKPPADEDRGPRNHKYDMPDLRQYDYGREVYAVKLGCPKCPLGDKPLDETIARRFLVDDTLWQGLSDREEEAVSVYLRKLYNLQ